jgi:hypothetical protein
MAEQELRLDRAIDALADCEELRLGAADELRDLVQLARRVRELPADEWPDPTFPDRLVRRVVEELAPAQEQPVRRPRPRTRPRSRLRLGLGLASVGAVAVALAVVFSLDRSQPVSAAVLAGKAIAASSGEQLGPVSFTQVVVNPHVPGSFKPVPLPPHVVEHVTFAAADRWRVETIVTEPNGRGTTTILTVRNGDTIVAVTNAPDTGRTETRRHAGAQAELPSAGAYGAQIDPLTLLASAKTHCGRQFAPVVAGPDVAGRHTLLLRIGKTPCPSNDVAELNGPARFLVDAQTSLVLDAKTYDAAGRLTQHLSTNAIAFGGRWKPSTFRLPAPLPRPAGGPALSPLPLHPSRAVLRAHSAFTTVLPGRLPIGVHAGPVSPLSTLGANGKLLSFSVTYEDAGGRALFQLYEAAATTASVRFPGRRVAIRPGIVGTYSDSNGLQILWWIEHGAYCSLQQGGVSAGVPLVGTLPLSELLRVAGSMS